MKRKLFCGEFAICLSVVAFSRDPRRSEWRVRIDHA